MKLTTKDYISLVIWIASFLLMGSFIGSLTQNGVNSWYSTLNRSPLTPPNYLFGVVWSILYAMIAISGWIIWRSKAHLSELKRIKGLYISQLILNWSWSPIFFTYQLPDIALICLCLIVTLVSLLVYKTRKHLKTVCILLTPYLLWLLFATHLNFYIWQHN